MPPCRIFPNLGSTATNTQCQNLRRLCGNVAVNWKPQSIFFFFRDVSAAEASIELLAPPPAGGCDDQISDICTFAAFFSSSFPSKAQLEFNFCRNETHHDEK